MKNFSIATIVMIAASILTAASVHADEASYAQVIKERDNVLSRILAERESRRSSGLADEEAVSAARLALYSFRRDVAKTVTEKIKNQELIMRIHEKKLEYVKAKRRTGTAAEIEVLEAMASLLEAKQIWEELRLKEKKG